MFWVHLWLSLRLSPAWRRSSRSGWPPRSRRSIRISIIFGPNNALRQHIFEGLVANNDKQQLIPSLAASWRAVDDRTWEFKLRPNVRFSNGTAFSATDVIYTLCRIPTVENSPSSFTVFTRGIDAIDTPDPLTLVVKTSEPLPLLPNSFAALGVLSAAAYGGGNVVYKPAGCETMGTTPKSAEFNNPAKAVGTGPYKLHELHAWQPRHPGAQRRLLGREAALEAGDLATVHERRRRVSRRCCRATWI